MKHSQVEAAQRLSQQAAQLQKLQKAAKQDAYNTKNKVKQGNQDLKEIKQRLNSFVTHRDSMSSRGENKWWFTRGDLSKPSYDV